ncbi:MAG: hypothetical protein RBS39_01590 [Phycisphaerales bacterium]|nr:hypothetical protein [Phycisphaerales bacterium]
MKIQKMIVGAGLALGMASGMALAHEGDVFVAIDANGKLTFEFDFDAVNLLAPVPIGSSVAGWLGDEPGFAELGEDEPDEGLFRIDAGANIAFQLVGSDVAFNVWDPLFNAILQPGDQFVLGGWGFDDHAFWHIDSDAPGFDPLQTVWSADFFIVDLAGIHAPSDVVNIKFTNVPAPGAGAMLASVMMFASRRRRA